jgi:hypothetical protein
MITGMCTNTFHTCAELAQRWRVGEESIRRWCRTGKLPYAQIGGRKLIPDWALEQVEQPRQGSPLQPTTNTKGGC